MATRTGLGDLSQDLRHVDAPDARIEFWFDKTTRAVHMEVWDSHSENMVETRLDAGYLRSILKAVDVTLCFVDVNHKAM